ncbi:MAG TPA: ATP phosphoribosyltransferase regulatory subunit [Hyphomicrobiaceae bacterium]|nr:ATP phosphoribosyltransferase regulatory subunit [Hyphomicrobiaceae bacterium]
MPTTATTTADVEALDALAQRLMAAFTRAGYERIAPAVIQPAELFLDVVGESLRARTYVFVDPDGAELCLRPDITVPTCRLHLERHARAATPARYCYAGSAFRYQPVGADRTHPREFRQAGIESFADSDRDRDDAAVLVRILAALREAGLRTMRLQLGDLGLLAALINALPMPERWRSRLRHVLARPEAFRAELNRLADGPAPETSGRSELLDRLDPDDPVSAEALVVEHLDKAGIELIGTRTAAEITQRLLAEAADRRERPLPRETAALIESYIAVKAPARVAVDRVAELARRHGIDLSGGLDAFARRLDLIENAGVSTADAHFSAEFGRNLDYYTGFVFEVVSPVLGRRSPIAGGGRYDNLLAEVGAPMSVPAVGASIHTERLLAALQNAGRETGA